MADTLPADVARCAGVYDDGWRDGCETCRRRTSGHPPSDRTVWMSPPLIVVFECEYLIPQDAANNGAVRTA